LRFCAPKPSTKTAITLFAGLKPRRLSDLVIAPRELANTSDSLPNVLGSAGSIVDIPISLSQAQVKEL
jgi:hypothetical protein